MSGREFPAVIADGQPLPMPRPRLTRHGGIMSNTKKVKEYKQRIALSAERAWKNIAAVPLTTDCGLRLVFFRETRVRADIDNLEKTVLDALLGIAYRDDRQVVEVVKRVLYGAKRPRVEITLYDLEAIP